VKIQGMSGIRLWCQGISCISSSSSSRKYRHVSSFR
jgi:hypothetical protein